MATSSAAQPPCLVFHNSDEQRSTLYNVSDGTHRPRAGDDIGELLRGNKLSWVTSHGRVLVRDLDTRATYLWNPHGRQKNRIALPSLARPPAKAGCVLSAEPTDGAGCTVLLADNRGLYVAAASPYLLDLHGELYVTYIFFRDIDFHAVKDVGVYRLDFERKEAVRVDGIGDRAILIGSSCTFAGWCPATIFGLLPNSVYWMSPFDGCLHVYDIEHKTEQLREPCGGVAEQSAQTSFWMIPTHL
ncbi:hypothetical protein ACQ4PT_041525 [Festuca glaucescens]